MVILTWFSFSYQKGEPLRKVNLFQTLNYTGIYIYSITSVLLIYY